MPKITYTPEEEDWLVTNVMVYRSIIENKITDGATNRDKKQAWQKIAKAFNVAPTGRERNVKSLREKYQKIKQTLKDRAYYFVKDANQTGGGPPKKELPALSEPMKHLAEVIMPSTVGLAATSGDSDYTIANELTLPSTSRKLAATGVVLGKISPDDGSYHLGDVDIDNSFFNEVEIITLEDPTDKQCSRADALTAAETQVDQLKIATDIDKQTGEMLSDEGGFVDNTWERANPMKLRKPTNFLLHNRRRKTESQEKSKKLSTSDEKHLHLSKKHKIEIEILLMERERYKFELERAELDRDRAALARERSSIELQRSKAQLVHDKEFHRLQLAALNRDNVFVPGHHTLSIPHFSETPTSFPTAAAKK